MPETRGEWVQLAYRLPREPSTPRIAVWRRLRRLGAVQIVDGLVALPRDSRTQEQLEWLADEIVEANGDATIWTATPGSAAHERALAERMSEAIAAEYRAVTEAAEMAREKDDVARRRTLARLRRALHAIRARDFFPPSEREQAVQAVEELAAGLVEVAP
jgi:Protein ChrB, N-terminal